MRFNCFIIKVFRKKNSVPHLTTQDLKFAFNFKLLELTIGETCDFRF